MTSISCAATGMRPLSQALIITGSFAAGLAFVRELTRAEDFPATGLRWGGWRADLELKRHLVLQTALPLVTQWPAFELREIGDI